MIAFDSVSVFYAGAAHPAIADVDLTIHEGELTLVIGPTGSGKSTLLRCLNGLVPHFSGGTLRGRVVVDGRDTRTHRPRDLADVVGFVGQDPQAGFVTDTVEDELAYGMESLGLGAQAMRKRVEETLDLLNLADLRQRPLAQLSGGQRQRAAIGSVLTMHPRVIVLDEPTSALDPQSAEEVLAVLQRLVHDLGLTVVVAEHRLERVVQYADRIVYLPGAGEPVVSGRPEAVMAVSTLAPPVVELGRAVGWDPIPMSVRDARRSARGVREQLVSTTAPVVRTAASAVSPALLEARDLVVGYHGVPVLKGIDVRARTGQIVALMGRNGAGKSTLLGALTGIVGRTSGVVAVDGLDPARLKPRELLSHVGLVPQDHTDLLYAITVAEECRQADADARAEPGTTRALLDRLAPGVPDEVHPRDLSIGQQLLVALAIVLAARPPLVLLDEPTRGLDYGAKRRLAQILRELAVEGHAIVLATHDVELVAEAADRVIVLGDGDIVADGETRDVVVASPSFAPQVAKVLGPGPWLTVADVTAALEAAS